MRPCERENLSNCEAGHGATERRPAPSAKEPQAGEGMQPKGERMGELLQEKGILDGGGCAVTRCL